MIERGFIEEFFVVIDPAVYNLRLGNVIVHTDGSIPIDTIAELTKSSDELYLIYPLISGDFYIGIEFATDDEFDQLCGLLKGIRGVLSLEKYKMLEPLRKRKPESIPEFTKTEMEILGILLKDPRMPLHDIASETGISLKKVRSKMDEFENGDLILFSAKWNPNLERHMTFTSKVTYDQTMDTDLFFQFLREAYNLEYIDSRNYQTDSTMFSFFTTQNLTKMEEIHQSILNYSGVRTCSTMIHYTAINRKGKTRLMLERMLESTL